MKIPHSLHAILWWVAFALAVVLTGSLLGCAGPTKMVRESDQKVALLVVDWATPEQIAQRCGPPRSGGKVGGCFVDGRIVAPRPVSWNDESALLTLGHEVYHLLGAKHD